MLVLSDGVLARTFEPRAPVACLLLLKRVADRLTLRRGVKPRQSKPSSVMKTRTRNELVLRNALEITVEEGVLPLHMCFHGQDDGVETRLKNGSFQPQIGAPRGTRAWYMPD